MLLLLFVLVTPASAAERTTAEVMAELRPESLTQAQQIRKTYRGAGARLAIDDRADLRRAIESRTIVRLTGHAATRNIDLRLDGPHPIGEMDRAHQALYLGARPETIGCLFDVASRVRSGPLEVTSLVRHAQYQRSLARRNANARTAVPTHVMGLAFDISVKYSAPATVRELRDVLKRMAADGDLFFIAEQRQQVFHVVPAPRKRAYYAALADAFIGRPHPALPTLAWPARPDFSGGQALPAVQQASLLPALEAFSPGQLKYGAFFVWLVGSGFGVPPGEDVLLAGAGALMGDEGLAWWLVLLAIVAVLISDSALFFLGRGAGKTFAGSTAYVPGSVAQRIDRFAERWGTLAIAGARFVPGSRTIVYVSAGARGVSPIRFICIDALAALIWVPLVMTAGAYIISLATGDQSLAILEAALLQSRG